MHEFSSQRVSLTAALCYFLLNNISTLNQITMNDFPYGDLLVELMLANTKFTLEEINEMSRDEINMHLGY